MSRRARYLFVFIVFLVLVPVTMLVVHSVHTPVLYAGDRMESLARLTRLRQRTDLLILDRYVGSNLAYQGAKATGAKRRDLLRWIDRLEHEVYGLPRADLTLFFDMPTRQAAELVQRKPKRTFTRRKADLHEENLRFMQATRRVYRQLAEAGSFGKWHTIPCATRAGRALDPADICEAAWKTMRPRLKRRSRR